MCLACLFRQHHPPHKSRKRSWPVLNFSFIFLSITSSLSLCFDLTGGFVGCRRKSAWIKGRNLAYGMVMSMTLILMKTRSLNILSQIWKRGKLYFSSYQIWEMSFIFLVPEIMTVFGTQVWYGPSYRIVMRVKSLMLYSWKGFWSHLFMIFSR
jgi:hypothetical protein